jgi:hypothetical protein
MLSKDANFERTERKRTQRYRPVHRFPRLERSAEESLEGERRRLENYAWALFSTRRKIRLELGRVFIRIKATFPHGGWKSYYEETFADTHVCLRTIQRWMRWARRADAASKSDSESHFKPAMDPDAENIRKATARAEAEVDKQSIGKQKPASLLYRLPLRMTIDERDRTDQLRRLPQWPRVEEKVIGLLNQLYIDFEMVKSESDRAETEASS